jgi:hypothetical protein
LQQRRVFSDRTAGRHDGRYDPILDQLVETKILRMFSVGPVNITLMRRFLTVEKHTNR